MGGEATSRSGLMSKIRALQWLFKQRPPPADLSQYGASSGRRQSARKTARACPYATTSAATRRHTHPHIHTSARPWKITGRSEEDEKQSTALLDTSAIL